MCASPIAVAESPASDQLGAVEGEQRADKPAVVPEGVRACFGFQRLFRRGRLVKHGGAVFHESAAGGFGDVPHAFHVGWQIHRLRGANLRGDVDGDVRIVSGRIDSPCFPVAFCVRDEARSPRRRCWYRWRPAAGSAGFFRAARGDVTTDFHRLHLPMNLPRGASPHGSPPVKIGFLHQPQSPGRTMAARGRA